MKYISLFSGIEAASVAWEPLGWEPVAFCEIDEFPSAVLAHRFPHVPNLGDITKVDWSDYVGAADLIVGGSPCQSFSVAGKREGLQGESGLMFEYIRAVREVRPRWFIWENVPGALSSEKGAAFHQLLSEMAELGYGLAWRVLDAQFFGVAQRRRRVFLVGSLGDQRAAEVLFEPDCLRWDHPSSREKREALTRASQQRAAEGGCDCLTPWDVQSMRVYSPDGSWPTLYAGSETSGLQRMSVLTGQCRAFSFDSLASNSMKSSNPHSGCREVDVAKTVDTTNPCPSKNQGGIAVLEPAPALEVLAFNTTCITSPANGNKPQFGDPCHTLAAQDHPPAIVMASGQANAEIEYDMTPAQAARQYKDPQIVCVTQYGDDLAGTLTARHDSSPCADRGQNIVCVADDNVNAAIDDDLCGSLKVGGVSLT